MIISLGGIIYLLRWERLEEEQFGGEIQSSALAILSLRGQLHIHIPAVK